MIGLIVLAIIGVGYLVVAREPIKKCELGLNYIREPVHEPNFVERAIHNI